MLAPAPILNAPSARLGQPVDRGRKGSSLYRVLLGKVQQNEEHGSDLLSSGGTMVPSRPWFVPQEGAH